MDADSSLTVGDVKDIIKENKLGISYEGAPMGYREFSIGGEDISKIEVFYGVPLRKGIGTKLAQLYPHKENVVHQCNRKQSSFFSILSPLPYNSSESPFIRRKSCLG